MRKTRTADELEAIQEELTSCASALGRVVKSMRDSGIPELVVHSLTVMNHRMPEVINWANNLESAARTQIATFKRGIPSKAEYEVMRYRRSQQKLQAEKNTEQKAAKKPSR